MPHHGYSLTDIVKHINLVGNKEEMKQKLKNALKEAKGGDHFRKLFYKKLTGYDYDKTKEKDGKPLYKCKKEQSTFIKNYLQFLNLLSPLNAKKIMMNEGGKNSPEEALKKLQDKSAEVHYLADLYREFANNSPYILERVNNKPDYSKEDIFRNEVETDANNKPTGTHKETFIHMDFSALPLLEQLEDIEQCEELQPSHISAKKAIIYRQLKNHNLAQQYAKEALEDNPENGVAWMLKGLSTEALRIPQKATGEEGSIVISPKDRGENTQECVLKSLLKAWKHLPSTLNETYHPDGVEESTYIYPENSTFLRGVIQRFITNAIRDDSPLNDTSEQKKLFLSLIQRDFNPISFTDETITPYIFKQLLPLVQKADSTVYSRLVEQWANSISSTNPETMLLKHLKLPTYHRPWHLCPRITLHPNADVLKSAIQQLSHSSHWVGLTHSDLSLSFSDMSSLLHHINILSKAYEHQHSLIASLNWHYQALNRCTDLRSQLEVYNAALSHNSYKNGPLDQTLLSPWAFQKLRIIADLSWEYMAHNAWDDLASFLTHNINDELLETASYVDKFHDASWLFRHNPSQSMIKGDDFHKIFKDEIEGRLANKPPLCILLEITLEHISNEPDVIPQLKQLQRKATQLFQSKELTSKQ